MAEEIPTNVTDRFRGQYGAPGHAGGMDWPFTRGTEITPDDSLSLPFIPRGIYVGTAGDLTVYMVNNTGIPITFNALPVGFYALRCARILDGGTTAGNIIIFD